MQDGPVPVVNKAAAFHRFVAVFIGGAVTEAALDTSTGHPAGKAFVVVIAAISVPGGNGTLSEDCAG